MPRKLHAPYWTHDIAISKERWASWEEATGGTFTPELRTAVLRAINACRMKVAEERSSVRSTTAKAELERLVHDLNSAQESIGRAIGGKGDGLAIAIALQEASVRRWKVRIDRKKFRSVRSDLIWLSDLADCALQALNKGGSGRPSEQHVDELLTSVGDAYSASGAKGLHQERGVKFLQEVCVLAELPPKSRDSIIGYLKKAKRRANSKLV